MSVFLNKATWWRLTISVKKALRHRCFLLNFVKFLEHLFYRTIPDDCFCTLSISLHRLIPINVTSWWIFFMLWQRPNAYGLIRSSRLWKVTRIGNVTDLRKFKDSILWFEIEISNFSSFFSLSSLFFNCTFDF